MACRRLKTMQDEQDGKYILAFFNSQSIQQALSKYHFWFFLEKVKRSRKREHDGENFPGAHFKRLTRAHAIKNEYPFTTGDYLL